MSTCEQCSGPIEQLPRGRHRRFCLTCRPRDRKLGPARSKGDPSPSRWMTCVGCGGQMHRSRTSLPPGEATCLACRRAQPKEKRGYDKRSPCIDCAVPSYGQRCRPCADTAKVTAPKRIRSLDDYRTQRRMREQDAPGLSAHSRSLLLARWKRQGRRCGFCNDRPADTVDHVVPLVRGGTNYEGNLMPCCRSCNGSKSGLMVSEWRHKKRLPPMSIALAWGKVRPRRKPRSRRWAEPAPLFGLCEDCGAQHQRRSPVCGSCASERLRIQMRNAHRARVGIPIDAPIRPCARRVDTYVPVS